MSDPLTREFTLSLPIVKLSDWIEDAAWGTGCGLYDTRPLRVEQDGRWVEYEVKAAAGLGVVDVVISVLGTNCDKAEAEALMRQALDIEDLT